MFNDRPASFTSGAAGAGAFFSGCFSFFAFRGFGAGAADQPSSSKICGSASTSSTWVSCSTGGGVGSGTVTGAAGAAAAAVGFFFEGFSAGLLATASARASFFESDLTRMRFFLPGSFFSSRASGAAVAAGAGGAAPADEAGAGASFTARGAAAGFLPPEDLPLLFLDLDLPLLLPLLLPPPPEPFCGVGFFLLLHATTPQLQSYFAQCSDLW